MSKRITYDDGATLDLDDDIEFEDLPEGDDAITDDEFSRILADAEAEEAANAPDESEVDEEPDGADGDAG